MTYKEHFITLLVDANKKLEDYTKAVKEFEDETKMDGFKDWNIFANHNKAYSEWQIAQGKVTGFLAFAKQQDLKPEQPFARYEDL